MSISYSTLEATRYWPELLPSCEYVSPTTGNEAEVLNLTRLPHNLLVRLKDVSAVQDPDAELRLKADSEVFQVSAAAIPDLTEPTQYDLLASNEVRLAVYAIAGLTAYKICHGLWCWKATIADKLALGIPLTAEEEAINTELGIYKTVERGTLPAVIDRFKLYEYFPIYKETRSIRQTVPVTGLAIDTIRPRRPGEQFVVLEKISCDTPSAVGDNVCVNIWRDDDGSAADPMLVLKTWVMALGYDIPMWLPARREINIRISCDVEQTNYRCRYTYGIYRLTNILRARWGLIEEPAELIRKVKGGIA